MTEMSRKDGNPVPDEVNYPGDNINQITETSLCENTTNNARMVVVKNGQEPPPDINLCKLKTQVMASLSVSLGSMVVGFASAYSSPALASMTATNTTMTPTPEETTRRKTSHDIHARENIRVWNTDTDYQAKSWATMATNLANLTLVKDESWIGSLMPLCAIIGGVAGGPLIEVIGRKTTILATALPFIASWLLIGLAVNIPMIYIGRSIAGVCVGIASLCFPVYLGETLQPEVRGMLGLLPTTIGNIGMLMAYVAGKYMSWSTLALFGATLPVPFLILTFLIPETPRWYISKNKDASAKQSLQWLRGKDADIAPELAEIKNAYIEEQKNATVSSFDLFKTGNLKLVAISLGLMYFQQMSGINALVFYSTSIFEGAGDSIDKFLSSIIMGIVNFGATFLASLLIDRLGRKVLLYISGSAMMVSLIALGAYFYLKNINYDVASYGWLPLASIVTYITAFSFGYGPVPWLMMGEILPVKIRGAAASIVTGFNWSFTFCVTKSFQSMNALVGEHWTFWTFALMCFIGLFFVFFCVPETQGRTLDDIEKKFKGRTRRMSSVANLKPLPMAI